MLSGVARNAIPSSTLSFPTTVLCARFSISVTTASRMWLARRAMNATLTRSPVSADIELRSATNTGLPPSSGVNEFLPLDFLVNTPSCTCVLVLSLYENSPDLAR